MSVTPPPAGPVERPAGQQRQGGWRLRIKRALDQGVAAAVLTGTAPIMGAVAAGVWLSMGRPILFVQERPGRHAKPFRLLKFRTMRTPAPGEEATGAADGARLTAFGRFLRSASLDELPQMVNVLRGDMSLVGPRPLLTRYLDRYTPEQARRHEVLPGITGLAQINGRNATTWEDRLRRDVEYVDTWSLSLDARILWTTLWRVVRREGIDNREAATMTEFWGSAGKP